MKPVYISIGGHPAHEATAFGLDDIPRIYMYYMQTG